MVKNPKKKLLSIVLIIIILGALGYLAYNYRDLLSKASEGPPGLPSPDALGSADITPFVSNGWTLVAYPFATTADKDTNSDPTDKTKYITARLTSSANDAGKDPNAELSQIYEPIYKLVKGDTSYVQFNKTDINYNTKAGLGYWVYLDEKDDTTPPDNLLDDYATIINTSLKVEINSNGYTLIGNPYTDAVELSNIKFIGKIGNKISTMSLGDAVDQNLAIVYTYDSNNFGEEFTKLTGSSSLEPNQGAAIITKVKEASITFNKPSSSS